MMMAYNRYDGNTGRVTRVGDGPEPPHRSYSPPDIVRGAQHAGTGTKAIGRQIRNPSMPPAKATGGVNGFLTNMGLGKDSGILSGKWLNELETEDLLLMAILYLMYRESGDTELLIILGAMLFL